MLVLSNNQYFHLLELMSELNNFNEKRYQDITHHLANAISNSTDKRERETFITLLKLASSVWFNNEVIQQANTQLTKSLEG